MQYLSFSKLECRIMSANIEDTMTEKRKPEGPDPEICGISKKKMKAAREAQAKAGNVPTTGSALFSRYKHTKQNLLERVLSNPHDAWMIFDGRHTFAMLDHRPSSHGHVLIVLKEPAATLLESVSDDALLSIAKDTQAIVRALHKVTGCAGVKVLQNNGPAAGQTIPQLHTHIMPCYDDAGWSLTEPEDRVQIQDEHAGVLTAALRNTLPATYAPGFHYWASTADDMEALGHVLQHHICKPGHVILLHGQLGAGKSTISRGIVRAFCGDPMLDVPSPTFLLCLTYEDDLAHDPEARAAGNRPAKVHHMDPYRLGAKTDRLAGLLDFSDAMSKDVCLIEWPDRMPAQIMALAKNGVNIHIKGYGSQGAGRLVSITALPGDKHTENILNSWRASGLPTVDTAWRGSKAVANGLNDSKGAATGDDASSYQSQIPEDPSSWIVLGIESSCDDTAAAVVRGDGTILSHEIASQAGIHEQYGGVKPDAARDAHAAAIVGTVDACLSKASITAADLTGIAVTIGPGLSLCLQVGVRHALQLAAQHNKPVIPVHHMEAHTMMTRMPGVNPQPLEFPSLLLLVSGGHNMLVLCSGVGKYRILGTTIDDSVGECFDKTARLLGFSSIPGGPLLEKLARKGQPVHKITMPMQNGAHKDTCNFSFSGLKTSVSRLIDDLKAKLQLTDHAISLSFEGDALHCSMHKNSIHKKPQSSDGSTQQGTSSSNQQELQPSIFSSETEQQQQAQEQQQIDCRDEEVSEEFKQAYIQQSADIAASFTQIAVKFLQQRTSRALQWLKDDSAQQGCAAVKCLVVAGGVAANKAVRSGLQEVATYFGLPCIYPPVKYCTDNGLMVAWTGVERLKLGLFNAPPQADKVEKNIDVLPRWPLGPVDPRSATAANSKIFS